jgi:hypothetical protein
MAFMTANVVRDRDSASIRRALCLGGDAFAAPERLTPVQ